VRGRAAFALMLAVAPTGLAAAETPAPAPRLEVAVGGGLLTGADIGGAEAELRANAPHAQPFRLFTSLATFGRAAVVEARAAVLVTRRFGMEGLLLFGRPELRVSVASDVEGAAPLTVVERVDQYGIAAGIAVMIDELRLGRMVPYAAGGAGYLRQLHEGRTVVEHGRLYYLGGGVKHWWLARDRGTIRFAGVRGDVRLYVLVHGIAFDDRSRRQAAVTGSVVIGF
jgi:hypothetical protein